MGFGFGAGADMQKVYHANKDRLKGKKSLKELNEHYHENSTKKGPTYNKMSPEQYEVWKAKMDEDIRKEKIKQMILLAVLVAGGVLMLLTLLK